MLNNANLFIFHLLNGIAGNPVLDRIVLLLANYDFIRVMVLGAPIVYVWFSSRQQTQRVKLVAGILAACLAVVIARLLAHLLPFEIRPMFSPTSGYKPLSQISADGSFEHWSAFPSDSSAFSIAIAISIASVDRRLGLLIVPAVALLFGALRIYCGYHYPLDVAAGWALGAACWMALHMQVPPLERAFDLLQSNPKFGRIVPLMYSLGFVFLYELATMFDFTRTLLRSFSTLEHIMHF